MADQSPEDPDEELDKTYKAFTRQVEDLADRIRSLFGEYDGISKEGHAARLITILAKYSTESPFECIGLMENIKYDLLHEIHHPDDCPDCGQPMDDHDDDDDDDSEKQEKLS